MKEHEVEEVMQYVEQHLESTVGYWTEEEVKKNARDWRLIKQKSTTPPMSPVDSWTNADEDTNPPYNSPLNLQTVNEMRNKAQTRIASINSLDEAKAILNKLCKSGNEWVLNMIID